MKKNVSALTGVLFVLALVASFWTIKKPSLAQSNSQANKEWIDRVQPHLEWAAKETDKCVNDQMIGIDRFFQTAKAGVPQFLDKVLGWDSKWEFLLDKVPFTKGDRHSAFVTKTFEQGIFSHEQLEQSTKQLTAGFLSGIEAIENQMLVRIRQDVKDLPAKPFALDKAKLQAAFQQAVLKTKSGVYQQVAGEMAKELFSLITGEVLTQVTVRLGVSSGILGAGATSSLTTLGIGLAVGIAVDEVISLGWDRLADPKGKLTRHINDKIDDLHRFLIDGNADRSGLRQQLQEYSRQRSELRRQAIHSLDKKGANK